LLVGESMLDKGELLTDTVVMGADICL